MSADSEILALKARVAELESRLEFVYKRFNLEYTAEADRREAQVVEMIKQGNMIEAIKIHREIYNVGLAEAKKAVDGIRARMGL